MTPHLAFSPEFRRLDPGPHACTASAHALSPAPQPQTVFLCLNAAAASSACWEEQVEFHAVNHCFLRTLKIQAADLWDRHSGGRSRRLTISTAAEARKEDPFSIPSLQQIKCQYALPSVVEGKFQLEIHSLLMLKESLFSSAFHLDPFPAMAAFDSLCPAVHLPLLTSLRIRWPLGSGTWYQPSILYPGWNPIHYCFPDL